MPSALAPTDHASSPFVAASAAFLSSNHGETLSPGVPRKRHYYLNSTKQTLSQTHPLGEGGANAKIAPNPRTWTQFRPSDKLENVVQPQFVVRITNA